MLNFYHAARRVASIAGDKVTEQQKAKPGLLRYAELVEGANRH